jgi:1,4-dihydroxy-2-naphthoate octaprenyltransferase
MMFTPFWAFIQLTRPLFLLGGALVYALGAVIAAQGGATIDGARYALGQLLVTSVQLMTHYSNEYFDLESDRGIGAQRTWFSGGSGVLPAARLSPRVALIAARVCGLVALIAITLIWMARPIVAAIGILALLGGWFYSAPPLRLSASGVGELSTSLIVALLTPLSGALMQGGAIGFMFIAATLPLLPLHVAMLLAFEMPDFDADRASGKRTLAVRLGRRRTVVLHNGLLIAAGVLAYFTVRMRWIDSRVSVWLLWVIPLAIVQCVLMLSSLHRRWAHFTWLTSGAVGLFAIGILALLAGFLS